MNDVLVSSIVNILTGFGLWLFLPRGVVLTKTGRNQSVRGETNPWESTWDLKNDSALPIRLLSVTVRGAHNLDPMRSGGNEAVMPVFEGAGTDGVSLSFEDKVLESLRTARSSWNGVEVGPGEALQANLTRHQTLMIVYRRAGWFGVLERRLLVIFGRS